MSGGVTVPTVSHGQAFALEFIVTFILMLVNMAMATDTCAVRTIPIKYSAQFRLHFVVALFCERSVLASNTS